jgi:hypothetical protein
MTYDDLVKMALEHVDVAESTSYGNPSVKRRGRYMFGLNETGETISVKLDWENRDWLLGEHPGVIYITPHYHGYPAFRVFLDKLTPELGRELVEISYADAPNVAKKRVLP